MTDENLVPVQADDVFKAARDVQVAVRWYFHVYCSYRHNNKRWDKEYWLRNVAEPWCMWTKPVSVFRYCMTKHFLLDVYHAVRLLYSWWNFKW